MHVERDGRARAFRLAAVLILALILGFLVHSLSWNEVIARDDLCQCTGYLASILVLATFAMKDMRLLRITAILSNIAFITYAALHWLPPIISLHLLLLPINLLRLMEINRARRKGPSRRKPLAGRSLPIVLLGTLVATGHVAAHAEIRAWVGVTVCDAAPTENISKLGWLSGVTILDVHPDSPALSAGIQVGDIVVELDAQPLANASDLVCRIAARVPGSPARLTTIRGSQIRYAALVLGNWPIIRPPHCPEYVG
jgi:membrane-associated protease RseP (regulator of RpoE activity)